jgi:serine/threonine protein kinase
MCRKCGNMSMVGVAATATPVPTSPPVASAWTAVVERLRAATLGEFVLDRELGRGGMATVFLAHEVALNRKVAIKLMAPGLLMGEGMVERFRQEAVTVANMSHPNIVTIHTVRQIDDLHFFVMKFVEGRSLEHVVATGARVPIDAVRSLLFQVGNALAYAHRRGVIHRDVKPANILLDADGNAVVTDFGIAKVAESTTHTQTGTMVGTPAYMSPEQCYAGQVSWPSDQYSLGIVAYELLTGRVPFSGPSFTVMKAHIEGGVRTVPPSSSSASCGCWPRTLPSGGRVWGTRSPPWARSRSPRTTRFETR